MRVRIVVADRAEARFYDAEHADGELRQVGRITDPQAQLRDRDFKSDRPGRVFDHAPGSGRRGAVAHHDTGGERKPLEHEAELFARRVVDELDRGQQQGAFDRLVLMAPPEFLGRLRALLPKSLRSIRVHEVGKDLVHQDQRAIRAHVPAAVFSGSA